MLSLIVVNHFKGQIVGTKMPEEISVEEEMTVREYLLKKGFKESQLKLHTIFVNNKKASLDDVIKKDDKVMVLPILKGGEK